MIQPNFSFKKQNLTVSFRDLSTGVPENSEYFWDFGDLRDSNEKNPTHVYEASGFYTVKLKITEKIPNPEDPSQVIDGESFEFEMRIGISETSKTQLSDSIYVLIDAYIPPEFKPFLNVFNKQIFIEKWQLYLQPIVNHEIPLEDYNDELAYEALENQLVMELSVYDYLMVEIMHLINRSTESVKDEEDTGDEEGGANQRVKAITTGPSEVQFFEGLSGSNATALAKSATLAMQPGGFIESLKQNLCMLAERLEIYLPICKQPFNPVVPKVVNRRKAGPLSGPNPTGPLRNHR